MSAGTGVYSLFSKEEPLVFTDNFILLVSAQRMFCPNGYHDSPDNCLHGSFFIYKGKHYRFRFLGFCILVALVFFEKGSPTLLIKFFFFTSIHRLLSLCFFIKPVFITILILHFLNWNNCSLQYLCYCCFSFLSNPS